MGTNRRSYEARVLVVPMGASGAATVQEMGRAGLVGVSVLQEHQPANGQPGRYQLGAIDIESDSRTLSSLAETMSAVDVVVLVASDLEQVSDRFVEAVTRAGRDAGALLAAVTVGVEARSASGEAAMALLRAEVDMLVGVRRAALGAAFLDVVRGGAREEAGALS